ncbi:hypothetical protein E2562_019305 [Oryza meyeriana var. granulata]|uniref:Uncharacterized protein n=1 Tax=Oryza meyeriana var. granulata TaxID=110450 RepID=A0A6G1FAH2_9ORYZ|nr:hypothetical protein E2562_019305 [Oryza meyeriana var. granulata]KAF0933854.1 hypothetical protein E2562_019305 [Oryza meyeriana var. granulata]KAF0933855.1 hypothetical protein E2562_019305 [Oryza meyeriana var. granulata]KAF0933856.1 hypothetical protein E2562_019305 [Oryza meyeriana var. granulata]
MLAVIDASAVPRPSGTTGRPSPSSSGEAPAVHKLDPTTTTALHPHAGGSPRAGLAGSSPVLPPTLHRDPHADELSSAARRRVGLWSPWLASPLANLHQCYASPPARGGRSSKAPTLLTVRCEQTVKQDGGGGGSGADLWLGRLAMVSFTTAVVIKVSTVKGLIALRSDNGRRVVRL